MTIALAELIPSKAWSKRKLHAVFFSYPGKGHSIPMLHFAKRLHSAGVIVTFVNTFSHLSPEHFKTLDVGLDSGIRVVPLGVPPLEGEGKEALPYVQRMHELVPDAEALVETLFAENEDAPPSCIVGGMFVGWSQVVAKKFGIPWYVLFASPASGLATMLHIPELLKQGRLPIDPSRKEELVCDIPGVPPTRLADLPGTVQNPNSCVFSYFARICEHLHEPTGILVNTYYDLEASVIDTLRRTPFGKEGRLLNILPVGPVLPNAYLDSSMNAVWAANVEGKNPCLQWLDTQPDSSVVYISFGTVAVLSIPQIQELAMGVEASGHRFLMVLRSPLNPDNLPLLPEGFEDRTKGRGLVVRNWAPQLWVLSHRAVGGFLTHCGWNSTQESICRGVPLLTWPIQAEQAQNSRFIVDVAKAGLEVCTVTDVFVTKEQISKGIRSLLSEPEGIAAKNNIQKLKDLALAAVTEGGSSQMNLETFFQQLRSWKSNVQPLNFDEVTRLPVSV